MLRYVRYMLASPFGRGGTEGDGEGNIKKENDDFFVVVFHVILLLC